MAVGIWSPGGAPIPGGARTQGRRREGLARASRPGMGRGTQREAQSLLFLRLRLVHPVLTLLP